MNLSTDHDPVTIIMPVYNGSSFVQEQIESIMNQSYKNIKLIVRDNFSTDETTCVVSDLCKKYDNITLIRSSKNEGVVGNITALLEFANDSSYVMFSDSDDVWLPNKVALTKKKMDAIEGTYGSDHPCLIHSNLCVVDEHLKVIHHSFWKYTNLNPTKNRLKNILVQNNVTGCTVMINKSLLELACPLPSNIIMHDWWFALVAAAFGKIDHLEEATMLYRQHGQNDTGAKKYGVSTYFKTKKRNIDGRIISQTREFTKIYYHHFDNNQLLLLTNFIAFKQTTSFKKIYLMMKFGFFKNAFLRNVKDIFMWICFSNSTSTSVRRDAF